MQPESKAKEMYKQCKIGVVIPAFNVEGFIKNTVEELSAYIDKIYVIDDGSSDNTVSVVKTLSDSRVSL